MRFVGALAFLISVLASSVSAQSVVPIWHLPTASTPYNGSEAVPISQLNHGITAAYQTPISALSLAGCSTPTSSSCATARANLGVAKIITLESVAVGLGVSLGTADDGAVITAANAQIVAAKHSGGLLVMMPLNQVINSSVGLLLDNNGGWGCANPGQCTWQAVRANSDASTTWAVTINDPYATNVILAGIKFMGTWDENWLGTGSKGAWIGKQGGINLTQAYNGVNDAQYIANSTLGLQERGSYIVDEYIANFGGTCFTTTGAGAVTFHNIRIEGCGSYGMIINTYDSKFSDIDVGATGRTAVICDSTGCANDQFEGLKAWYAGFAQVADDDHDLIIYGNTNHFVSLNLQDSAGSALVVDNGFGNSIVGDCQWQGQIPWMDSQVWCVSLRGTAHNQIIMNADIGLYGTYGAQLYPTVMGLVEDHRSVFQPANLAYSTNNLLTFAADNFQNEPFTWYAPWFVGPLDLSNQISMNGTVRQTKQWVPDPASGNLAFGSQMAGSLVGVITDGAQGYYPGQVTVLAQNAGGQLQGFKTTAASAIGTFTASTNFANADRVTIGNKTWTFRTSITTPSSFQASISGTTMTVSSVYSGALRVGDTVTGTTSANTVITALGSGAGGTGTYTVNNSQSIASEVMSGGTNQVLIGSNAASSIINLRWAINALAPSYFVGYISGTTLTVTQAQTGLLNINDQLTCQFVQASGAACTATAGTKITAISGSNTGLLGTYTVNNSQTLGSAGLPVQLTGNSGYIGTNYGYGTVASQNVTASDNGSGVLTVSAIATGTGGNSITTTAVTSHASWGAGTLSGGSAGTSAYANALLWRNDGHINSPQTQLQGHYTSDASYCASPGAQNGDFYTDTTSGRAVVYQASC